MGHNGCVAPGTKLTVELRADIERELAEGVPVAVVAQRKAISRRNPDTSRTP